MTLLKHVKAREKRLSHRSKEEEEEKKRRRRRRKKKKKKKKKKKEEERKGKDEERKEEDKHLERAQRALLGSVVFIDTDEDGREGSFDHL